ncbi:unnamed protein product [Mytilus coruscus]|uniref:Uncharacterized protein n=1 Tax=Mytilus coruscus TaxID=42192 RepID=A0A6J8BYY6_MYTCO|nr:unnamed protein product [Mytilus coruscus]
MTSIRETTQQIAESMTGNNSDIQNLLASWKSFLQDERERLQTCYVTTDQAERQADDLQTKLTSGSKKLQINHHELDQKDNVTLNGKLAGNGGQILKQFAKDNNIDIHRFNPHLKISGRDHLQRIRLKGHREQVSYTPAGTEDLEELRKGIVFDGIPYTFELRFFSGDGPARQFEALSAENMVAFFSFTTCAVFTVKST